MSTTETTEQTGLLCPSCGEALEAAQTICVACRSTLEEQVLAVRAADHPALLHNIVRNAAEPPRGAMDPTSMDMLKVAENTSDDLDLVPLVPMDEPRKGANGNGSSSAAEPVSLTTASAPGSSGSSTSSMIDIAVPLAASPTPAVSAAPTSRPSHTAYTPPSAPKLEPSSRWKHVVVAVVCLAAAAALAAVLWSVLVPTRGADTDDAGTQPAAKAATK